MDAKDIRNLQEAYMEVVENQQLDEAREDEGLTPLQKIRKRNKKYALPGEPAGQQTSNRRAERSSTRGVKKVKGAKSAFGTMRHVGGPYTEEVDIYDIILSHLLDEGYADTQEAAEAIMVNMSEEWREDIVEISQKTATKAYATSYTGEFEGQDSPKNVKQTDNLRRQIKRKFGDKAAQHADRAGHAMTFGRKGAGGMPPKP